MGASGTESTGKSSKGAVHAVAGGLAGATARLVVGPLDVVKIRMQVQLEPVTTGFNSKYTGLRQALCSIFKEEGVKVSCRPCEILRPFRLLAASGGILLAFPVTNI